MNDTTPLPLNIVESLQKAGISAENEIFYDDNKWIYRKRMFPSSPSPSDHTASLESLGPFEIHPVDISVVPFLSTSTYIINKIGDQEILPPNQPNGIYSPLSQITLDGFARTLAKIPDDATHFCWLYPPQSDSPPKSIEFSNPQEMEVLRLGAFAYFKRIEKENKEDFQFLRVNSLVLSGTNGLVFDGPFPWRKEFTEKLWEQNRFQPVTSPLLREKGARYFAFIVPSEAFSNEIEQTPWIPSPNGAFAYLFNDDHSANVSDCYFSIADYGLGESVSDD